jgi:hypothetical protein
MLQEGALQVDPEDPLLDPCLISHNGHCRRPDLCGIRQEVTA